MANQQTTITSESLQGHQREPQQVQPGPVSRREDRGQEQALRMTGLLQTTLEIDQLIELFSSQLKPLVSHGLVSFTNDEYGINCRRGKSGPHTCNYRLVVNEEPLGELTLARHKPFADEEIKTIELMLCTLVYPLRNALLYRRALHAAHKDPLTGVNNRYTLNETLRREIDLARRHDRPLSLLVLDIDFFKKLNDSKGHAAGDCVLKQLAEQVTACMRGTDILFRYGGEEFVALLNNTDEAGALRVAERVRKAIERSDFRYNDEPIKVTVSLGVATLLENESEKTFFTRADEALYEAKSEGRNRVHIAEGDPAVALS